MRKGIVIILAIIASTSFLACNKGEDDSCNGKNTRREVKLATDDVADEIDTIAIVTTVDSLGGLDLIEADKNTERQEIEKKVFSVTAKVHKVSTHRDGDYKVKLISEDEEKYLNCEAPNPGCEFAPNSRFYTQIMAVRTFMEEHEDDLEGQTVTITGVAFIDIPHNYPRNAAENDIELHPILDISF